MANRDREPLRYPREARSSRRDRRSSAPTELRILLPTAQLLMGFLLVVPFTDRFARLPPHERGIYLAAAVCAANSALLLAAPLALGWIDRRSRLGMATPGAIDRVVAAGRIALASAAILTADMVGNGIGGDGFGIGAALVAALLILVTTMVLPPADDDDRWCA